MWYLHAPQQTAIGNPNGMASLVRGGCGYGSGAIHLFYGRVYDIGCEMALSQTQLLTYTYALGTEKQDTHLSVRIETEKKTSEFTNAEK